MTRSTRTGRVRLRDEGPFDPRSRVRGKYPPGVPRGLAAVDSNLPKSSVRMVARCCRYRTFCAARVHARRYPRRLALPTFAGWRFARGVGADQSLPRACCEFIQV